MDTKIDLGLDPCISEGPQSALEMLLIKEYLCDKGYRLVDLAGLPEELAKQLLTEACRHATLQLAEHEARAAFKHKIEAPT